MHGFALHESEVSTSWVSSKANFGYDLKLEEEVYLPGGRDCYHTKYPVKKKKKVAFLLKFLTKQKVNGV